MILLHFITITIRYYYYKKISWRNKLFFLLKYSISNKAFPEPAEILLAYVKRNRNDKPWNEQFPFTYLW